MRLKDLKRNDEAEKQYYLNRRKQRAKTFANTQEKLKAKLEHIWNSDVDDRPDLKVEKMITMYEQNLKELHGRITAKHRGMETALQLFNKNKYREEHKIEEIKDSVIRVETYLKLCRVKPTPPIPERKQPPPTLPIRLKEIIEPLKPLIPVEPPKVIPPLEEDDGSVEPFKCPHCEKQYIIERHFINHLKNKHGEK